MLEYFTSDWHFSHKNIIKYGKRPFKDIKEMNGHLLKNLIETVSNKDNLYFLGDFTWDENYGIFVLRKIKELGINFIWIKGNHDKRISKLVDEYTYLFGKPLYETYDLTYNKKLFILNHFPMLTWSRSHFNSYHIYGHHHAKINHPSARSYNATVELNNYKPVSITQIIKSCKGDNWDKIKKGEK
jgi:calcineurin-like phosphoesterase family protein